MTYFLQKKVEVSAMQLQLNWLIDYTSISVLTPQTIKSIDQFWFLDCIPGWYKRHEMNKM